MRFFFQSDALLYIELVTVWFQQQRILDRKEAAVVLKDQVSSMLLKQTNESAVEDLYFGLILIILCG